MYLQWILIWLSVSLPRCRSSLTCFSKVMYLRVGVPGKCVFASLSTRTHWSVWCVCVCVCVCVSVSLSLSLSSLRGPLAYLSVYQSLSLFSYMNNAILYVTRFLLYFHLYIIYPAHYTNCTFQSKK